MLIAKIISQIGMEKTVHAKFEHRKGGFRLGIQLQH